MSAKHGSAGSFRRLLGCAFALVLALSAVFAASASAVPVTHSDVALGDSLAFGYSQQLINENEKLGEPPTAFEHGYANDYYMSSGAKLGGAQLQNLGCPGETSGSLIGNGPLAAALEGGNPEVHGASPCGYHYGLGLPLHKSYGGSKSQLEATLETIAVDAGLGKPATTVTLNIGANDQLAQVKACEKEVGEEYGKEGKSKYGATPEGAVKGCLEAHLEGLIKHILNNMGAALTVIREGSKFGGVNYEGKIVIQGGYDPYGNVFNKGELLPGSVTLAALINKHEGELAGAFGACFANPLPTFNPGGKKESVRLQKWTNMANFTEFEGKKNGPDIHPTPAGYHKLALIMIEQCGGVV
jgi:lysophospholipase L1-like esterase